MLALSILLLFLVLVALGFPIFIGMGLSALVGTLLLGQSEAPLVELALTAYQSLGNFVLLAVPLYILVGSLMEETGLNEQLFKFASSWTSRLPGGLGVATVGACAIFSAISGSSVATVATIGIVAFPALTKRGYQPEFAGALIASGGTLGILIPPSIAMIVFGVLTEQSIGELFIAGIVPGLVLALLMSVYTMSYARIGADAARVSWGERLKITRDSVWVISLPVIVLVSIYTGIATPTEVAAIAVVYVLVLGAVTGSLNLRKFIVATLRAGRTSAMIFMLYLFGRILTEFFTLTGLPQLILNTVNELGLSLFSVVALMVILYLILGTFLESISMMLVSVPILYPVATSLGIDPLAFGVFVVLAIEAGLITPPVGINLYTLASIGRVHLGRLSLHALPYVALLVLMMFAVTLLPALATWLPGTMR